MVQICSITKMHPSPRANLFLAHGLPKDGEPVEAVTVSGAMVVALLSGLYMGLGLRTAEALDRRAELWFGTIMWVLALVGGLLASTMWSTTVSGNVTGGQIALGLVLGALALLLVWSFLHFPKIKVIEVEMPQGLPLLFFLIALIAAIAVGFSGAAL
jgi:hypothetical protein